MAVKFNDQFLLTEWLQRYFSYFDVILPLDSPEIFNISRIRALFLTFRTSRNITKKLETILQTMSAHFENGEKFDG